MQRQRGFTLIELLVVIAIIGILATLVVTQLGTARVKARNSTAKSDLSEAGKAIEVYLNNNEGVLGASVAGGDTLDSAGVGTNFKNMFIGTESASTYSLKLTKTPSTQHTYTYKTALISATNAKVASTNYALSTTLDVKDTSSKAAYWVANSVSGEGDVAQIPTP